MSAREDILEALRFKLAQDPLFPTTIDIDVSEPQHWDAIEGGLEHAAAVQDGPLEIVAELQGDGDTHPYELRLEAAVAYAVAGRTRPERRARRDAAAGYLETLIALDRTLGQHPETYAELGPPDWTDDLLVVGGRPCATAVIPVIVLFTARSPAG